jgi:hypothetical protein
VLIRVIQTVRASSNDEVDAEQELEKHIIMRIKNRSVFLQLVSSGIRDAGDAIPREFATRLAHAVRTALNDPVSKGRSCSSTC